MKVNGLYGKGNGVNCKKENIFNLLIPYCHDFQILNNSLEYSYLIQTRHFKPSLKTAHLNSLKKWRKDGYAREIQDLTSKHIQGELGKPYSTSAQVTAAGAKHDACLCDTHPHTHCHFRTLVVNLLPV